MTKCTKENSVSISLKGTKNEGLVSSMCYPGSEEVGLILRPQKQDESRKVHLHRSTLDREGVQLPQMFLASLPSLRGVWDLSPASAERKLSRRCSVTSRLDRIIFT